MKFKILLLTVLISALGFAQKKEKIKGNKFVKVLQHQIDDFNTLTLGENLEVFLLKGVTPQIEIEADENLHEVIKFSVTNNELTIKTTHTITSKKKLNIRVTVSDSFNTIVASEKATINTLIDLELNALTITAKNTSRVYATVKADTFKLSANERSKVELNLDAKNSTIEMSESTDIKALINSEKLAFDLYQKANAKIEGDVAELKLRADNATNFKGAKLAATNCNLIAEGSADCYIDVKERLSLEASGSSEVHIYNTPAITITKFADSASLYKE